MENDVNANTVSKSELIETLGTGNQSEREVDILKIAAKTLDLGLDFSRTSRIIRATEKELINFAEAIIAWHINNARGESINTYMRHKYPNML